MPNPEITVMIVEVHVATFIDNKDDNTEREFQILDRLRRDPRVWSVERIDK